MSVHDRSFLPRIATRARHIPPDPSWISAASAALAPRVTYPLARDAVMLRQAFERGWIVLEPALEDNVAFSLRRRSNELRGCLVVQDVCLGIAAQIDDVARRKPCSVLEPLHDLQCYSEPIRLSDIMTGGRRASHRNPDSSRRRDRRGPVTLVLKNLEIR